MNDQREQILNAVKANQPGLLPLPDISGFVGAYADVEEQFTSILNGIGGRVFRVVGLEEAKNMLGQQFGGRIISRVDGLEMGTPDLPIDPHDLADVDLAILQGQFAVAENGAIWLTETQMGNRVLPFICQHLSIIISVADLLPTMHEAYRRISDAQYGFGAFIAGPSKTADIEQSLVLGAHGARSMTVFIID